MKALLLAAFSAALAAASPTLPGRPATGRVLDETGALSEAGKARIQGVSDELESRTGAQLAVAVVRSLDGTDAADYANRLFRAWGVGRQGQDDGVLILVCPPERKARIEVGYGLEGKLPDVVAGRILKDELRPYFQAGRFEDGILEGARRIEEIVSARPASQAPVPRPRPAPSGGGGPADGQWFMIAFLSVFVLLGAGAMGAGIGAIAAGAGAGAFFMPIWGLGFSVIPLAMARGGAGPVGFWLLSALWAAAGAWAYRWGRRNPDTFKNSGGTTIGGGGWSSSSDDFGSSSGFGGGSDFGGGSSGGGGASDSW